MKLRDPRTLLAGATLIAVLAVVWFDRDRTSPGPLAPAHAQDPRLADGGGCKQCHGGITSSMSASCAECHAEIDRQVAGKTGFHGTLAGVDPAQCAACHSEHHGDALELAGAHAFQLAGVADPQRFDHAALGFELAGRHREIACKECHANAEVAVLAVGTKRFLGLDQQCTTCHEDPHKGRFARGCETCHGQEHAFADAANFVHTASFPLTGGHGRSACADCHAKDGPYAIEVLGGKGPFPAARACLDCHASPHSAAFVAQVARTAKVAAGESCSLCHEADRGPFAGDGPHMPRELHAAGGFALAKPHAEQRCEDCHARTEVAAGAPPAAFAAAFAVRYPGRKADDCAACHTDPHRGQFEAGPFGSARCVDCHAQDSFAPHRFDVAAHARSSFALTGAHVQTACNDCHDDVDGDVREFHGTPATCDACHRDAHRGAFAPALALLGPAERERVRAGTCALCHTTASFGAVAEASFDHAHFTAFALDGAHARVGCAACHAPAEHPDLPGRTFGFAADRFQGPLDRCDSCHADVHQGAFERALASRPAAAGCAECHTTESFAGAPARDFDHALFTGFALAGGPERATCESCHGTSRSPTLEGRTLGRVRDLHPGSQSFERCDACHADVHEGRFDRAGLPSDVAGKQSCARCHDLESFSAASAEFDHARWTGFALEGEHAKAACVACHVPGPASTAGMKLGRAAGQDCTACHADPHVGQFNVGGRTDCARCHAGATSFQRTSFDHGRDSRFALDATHAKLACSACHVPWPVAGGGKSVRYKPLGTLCGDCHVLPGTKHGTLAPGREGGRSP